MQQDSSCDTVLQVISMQDTVVAWHSKLWTLHRHDLQIKEMMVFQKGGLSWWRMSAWLTLTSWRVSEKSSQ